MLLLLLSCEFQLWPNLDWVGFCCLIFVMMKVKEMLRGGYKNSYTHTHTHSHTLTHTCLAWLTSKLIIYNVAEDSFKIRKWNAGLIETMCLSLSQEERVARGRLLGICLLASQRPSPNLLFILRMSLICEMWFERGREWGMKANHSNQANPRVICWLF